MRSFYRGSTGSAVRRRRHVRPLAVSFGVTVVGTRLYLSLTGWPQIGGGEYHIAHALWGGLLLLAGGVITLLRKQRLGSGRPRCASGWAAGCSSTRSASSSPPATTTSPRWRRRSSTRFFLAVLGIAVWARGRAPAPAEPPRSPRWSGPCSR